MPEDASPTAAAEQLLRRAITAQQQADRPACWPAHIPVAAFPITVCEQS